MNFRLLVVLIGLSISSIAFAKILPEEFTADFIETDVEYMCTFAPSQSALVNRLSALASGGGLGAEMILLTNRLQYVRHSSGRLIMTASGRYLANTLVTNTIRTAGQIVIPVAFIVAGTAVVVELACVKTNHPELIMKLNENASEYVSNANRLIENASVRAKEVSSSELQVLRLIINRYKTITKDKFYKLIGETWYQRVIRKSKEEFQSD